MTRKRHGRFLGIPYDWRRPTRARLIKELWKPRERRILVSKAYGWGYGLNFAACGDGLSVSLTDCCSCCGRGAAIDGWPIVDPEPTPRPEFAVLGATAALRAGHLRCRAER